MASPSLPEYVDRIFFDALGHTGNTYYFRIVRRGDRKIFDAISGSLSTSTTWVNSSIALSETGTTGQFPIIIPTNLPTGHTYEITIYKQVGSYPANTDDVESTYEMKHGSVFGF